jgi:hypothetical protein
MTNERIIVLFVLALGLMCAMGFEFRMDNDNDLRKKISDAKSCEELGTRLNQYFRNADARQIAKWVEDPNLTIVMRASWQMADVSPLNPDDKASSFVNRFETRLCLSVPKEWKEELRNLFIRRQKGFQGSMHDMKGGFGFNAETELRAKATADTVTLVRRNAEVEFVINKLSLADVASRYRLDSRHIKVAISKGKEKSFVVFYSDVTDAYPLWCVDSKSGMILWEQTVWGTGNIGPRAGVGVCNVVITCDAKRVAICGRGWSTHLYIEVFSIENGRSELRFATNNWCIPSEG